MEAEEWRARQYGRAVSQVYSMGPHYKGGACGNDTALPVPFDERNNPNFNGCSDGNA